MATKPEKTAETEGNDKKEEKEERAPLFEAARKVLLASVGAIALAQDETEDFIRRLVERGEIAEKDGRKLIREMRDRRKKDREKVEDEVGKRVEEVLKRMKVPTKSDVESLNKKITDLSKKLDELKKSESQES